MIHDKDFYLQLAEKYNLYQERREPFSAAYRELTGKELNKASEASYPEFIAEFLNVCNENGIRLCKPLPNPGNSTVKLSLYPRKAPILHAKGVHSMKSMLSKDEERLFLSCIGIMGEWLYATNAIALAKIKDGSWQKYDGQIISYDQFDMIADGFTPISIDYRINYESVFPRKIKRIASSSWNIDALTNLAFGALKATQNMQCNLSLVGLQFISGKPTIYVLPENLYNLLRILRANGAKQVTVDYKGSRRALTFTTDNGNEGLVMPYKFIPEKFSGVLIDPICKDDAGLQDVE